MLTADSNIEYEFLFKMSSRSKQKMKLDDPMAG